MGTIDNQCGFPPKYNDIEMKLSIKKPTDSSTETLPDYNIIMETRKQYNLV